MPPPTPSTPLVQQDPKTDPPRPAGLAAPSEEQGEPGGGPEGPGFGVGNPCRRPPRVADRLPARRSRAGSGEIGVLWPVGADQASPAAAAGGRAAASLARRRKLSP